MTIEFDIAQPAEGQLVGPSFTVVGSFSNDEGNPFGMTCWLCPTGTTNPVQVLTPQIAFEEKTWQCSFQDVAAGDYDIWTSQSKSALPARTKRTNAGATPPVLVHVSSVKMVNPQPPLLPNAAGKHASAALHSHVRSDENEMGMTWLTLSGTCEPSYSLGHGYLIYAYLRVAGRQVSVRGRLTRMWADESSGQLNWTYDLSCHNWALSDATMVIAELWRVPSDPPSPRKHTDSQNIMPLLPYKPEFSVSCPLCRHRE